MEIVSNGAFIERKAEENEERPLEALESAVADLASTMKALRRATDRFGTSLSTAVSHTKQIWASCTELSASMADFSKSLHSFEQGNRRLVYSSIPVASPSVSFPAISSLTESLPPQPNPQLKISALIAEQISTASFSSPSIPSPISASTFAKFPHTSITSSTASVPSRSTFPSISTPSSHLRLPSTEISDSCSHPRSSAKSEAFTELEVAERLHTSGTFLSMFPKASTEIAHPLSPDENQPLTASATVPLHPPTLTQITIATDTSTTPQISQFINEIMPSIVVSPTVSVHPPSLPQSQPHTSIPTSLRTSPTTSDATTLLHLSIPQPAIIEPIQPKQTGHDSESVIWLINANPDRHLRSKSSSANPDRHLRCKLRSAIRERPFKCKSRSANRDRQLSCKSRSAISDRQFKRNLRSAIPDRQFKRNLRSANRDRQLSYKSRSAIRERQFKCKSRSANRDRHLRRNSRSAIRERPFRCKSRSANRDRQLSCKSRSAISDRQFKCKSRSANPDRHLRCKSRSANPDRHWRYKSRSVIRERHLKYKSRSANRDRQFTYKTRSVICRADPTELSPTTDHISNISTTESIQTSITEIVHPLSQGDPTRPETPIISDMSTKPTEIRPSLNHIEHPGPSASPPMLHVPSLIMTYVHHVPPSLLVFTKFANIIGACSPDLTGVVLGGAAPHAYNCCHNTLFSDFRVKPLGQIGKAGVIEQHHPGWQVHFRDWNKRQAKPIIPDSIIFDDTSWTYLVVLAAVLDNRNAQFYITHGCFHSQQSLLESGSSNNHCYTQMAMTHPTEKSGTACSHMPKQASMCFNHSFLPSSAHILSWNCCGALPVFTRRILGSLLDFSTRELQVHTAIIAAALNEIGGPNEITIYGKASPVRGSMTSPKIKCKMLQENFTQTVNVTGTHAQGSLSNMDNGGRYGKKLKLDTACDVHDLANHIPSRCMKNSKCSLDGNHNNGEIPYRQSHVPCKASRAECGQNACVNDAKGDTEACLRMEVAELANVTKGKSSKAIRMEYGKASHTGRYGAMPLIKTYNCYNGLRISTDDSFLWDPGKY